MATLILTVRFLAKVWRKESGFFLNTLIINGIAFLLFLAHDAFASIMIMPLFAAILPVLTIDFDEKKKVFFTIYNIDPFIRHYAKVILYIPLFGLVMLNAYILITWFGSPFMLPDKSLLLVTFGWSTGFFIFFHFIQSKTILYFIFTLTVALGIALYYLIDHSMIALLGIFTLLSIQLYRYYAHSHIR